MNDVVPGMARHNAEVLAPIYSRGRLEVNDSCAVPHTQTSRMREIIVSSKQIPKSDWFIHRRNASRVVYGDKRSRGSASEAGQQNSRLASIVSILLTPYFLQDAELSSVYQCLFVLASLETMLCYVVRHLVAGLVLR